MLLALKIAASLVALYLVVVASVALLQDRLLFPRWAIGPASPLPASAQIIEFGTSSGDKLIGLHLRPDDGPPSEPGLVLGFGGNAWSANDLALHLHSLFPDREVVAFHYRGYAPSTGDPSARAILDDAIAIHDHIVASLRPRSISIVGISLGAGPAAHLAKARQVEGLILVTPFDTLEALAREHYAWLPVRLLLRHRMDVAGDLASVTAPVAVISAGDDAIVPPKRTEAARSAARSLIGAWVIAGARHNDIFDSAEYRRSMREALVLIEAAGNR